MKSVSKMANELERALRATPNRYVLKANQAAKAVIWKEFSLIYLKEEHEENEMKYYCTCNKCKKVYAYKAADGNSFGTKNW